jgi:uncharacterized protein YndB with AHSA1/START domain
VARRPSTRTRRLSMTALVPASCERTFRAWTDPADIVRWWGRPWGMTVPSAEVDLRVGGRYRIAMRSPIRREVGVVGTYHEIEPPARLVYTLAWERGGWRSREMLVTVEFADRDGGTEIVLTHEMMSNEASRRFHHAGWRWGLKRLATLLARERSV